MLSRSSAGISPYQPRVGLIWEKADRRTIYMIGLGNERKPEYTCTTRRLDFPKMGSADIPAEGRLGVQQFQKQV